MNVTLAPIQQPFLSLNFTAPRKPGAAKDEFDYGYVLPLEAPWRLLALRLIMNDESATAVAAPSSAASASRVSRHPNGQRRGGIIARGEQEAARAISAAL